MLPHEASLPLSLLKGSNYYMRALYNSYFIKEDRLFFSSKALLGLVFSATYPWGSFAPSALS